MGNTEKVEFEVVELTKESLVAISKRTKGHTFGELADIFARAQSRGDVVFLKIDKPKREDVRANYVHMCVPRYLLTDEVREYLKTIEAWMKVW